MEEIKFTLETTVVGTTDGRETYEVRKKYNTEGKTAIVIALYPTVSLLNPMITDTSTRYFLNHTSEMGYNEIRIANIFSTVFSRKPSTKQLHESEENIQYIENMIDESDKAKTDFIVAWGSSLGKNTIANGIKVRILQMLMDKGWEKNIKHIVVDGLDTESQLAAHMLWLGLHFGNESWMVEKYPVKQIIEEMDAEIAVKPEMVQKNKRGRKKKAVE